MAAAPPQPAFLKKLHAPGRMPKNISICIYGREAVGKTTLAATMPGHGLLIVIPTVEGAGDVSLGHLYPRVEVHTILEWAEIEDDRKFLQFENDSLPLPDFTWGDNDERWQGKRFQWVAIDSLTGMQELATRRTLKERGLDYDPKLIRMDDWGKIGRYMQDLVHEFMILPLHTVWIAQERGGSDNDHLIRPDMTPAANAALKPAMMVIGRLFLRPNVNAPKKVDRLLRIGPHPDYVAKYRTTPNIDVPPVIKVADNNGQGRDLHKLVSYLLGIQGAPRPDEAEDNGDLFTLSGGQNGAVPLVQLVKPAAAATGPAPMQPAPVVQV